MKPFLLIVTLLLISSCAHNIEENVVCIQIKDHNGILETFNDKQRIQKFTNIDYLSSQPYSQVLRVFEKDKQDKTRSILTSYHPNGQIKQYMEGVDAVAKGPYLEWHANGKKKIAAKVVGGPFSLDYSSQKQWLFEGISKVWDEEESLVAEIEYLFGVLHGCAKYYHKTGSLKALIPYKNNRIHGAVRHYYKTSALRIQTFYQNGKKHGSSIGYWENEQPAFFEEYADDLLLNARYYDQNGELLCSISEGYGFQAQFQEDFLEKKIEYKEGVAQGEVLIYAPGEVLISKYRQKQGKKEGKELIFYRTSHSTKNKNEMQIKLSVDWDAGNVHGFVKTWYPNGKIESEKEYYRNEKNGKSIAWYQNGHLMLLEEYEKNILQSGSYYKVDEDTPVSKVIKGAGVATIYDGKSFHFLRKIHYEQGKPVEKN